MHVEVITLPYKTLERRLHEYKMILNANMYNLHPSNILSIWIDYLRCQMNICNWQAIWKVSKLFCEELHIEYPTMMHIHVNEVDFSNLNANVSILGVWKTSSINIKEKYKVPLINLYPTSSQTIINDEINENIANCLEKFRFFYTYLFMPWDANQNDIDDWIMEYLEERLSFYYSTLTIPLLVPYKIFDEVKMLFEDISYVNSKINMLSQSNNNSEDDTLQLQDWNVKMRIMKSNLYQLSSPLTLEALIQSEFADWRLKLHESLTFVIFIDTNINTQLEFLQNSDFALNVASNLIKIYYNLDCALQLITKNDNIILHPGFHCIEKLHSLEYGGLIKGIGESSETVIKFVNNNDSIHFSGNITFENLTLNIQNIELIIKGGSVCKFINCKIYGNEYNLDQRGFLVLRSGRLLLKNCQISKFKCGIEAASYSTVFMENCAIQHVHMALHACDDAFVELKGCNIENYKTYGICYETENSNAQGVLGDHENVDVLLPISQINIETVTMVSESGIPVAILRKGEI